MKPTNENLHFNLHDGPPYANGNPHVGHSLNKVYKYPTVPQPPNQSEIIDPEGYRTTIQKNPTIRCGVQSRLGLSRSTDRAEIDPPEFRFDSGNSPKRYQISHQLIDIHRRAIAAFDIATKYIDIQKRAFKSWGVSADWESHYATYHRSYQRRELEAFDLLYRKSLIFRDVLPTFWSCSSRYWTLAADRVTVSVQDGPGRVGARVQRAALQ